MKIVRSDYNLGLKLMTINYYAHNRVGEQRFEDILYLGRYNAFTLGIYKYTIHHINNDSKFDEKMPAELRSEIERNNFAVKLVDGVDGNYVYFFDNIVCEYVNESFYRNINSMVYLVSRQQISHINALIRQSQSDNSNKIVEHISIVSKINKARRSITSKHIEDDIDSALHLTNTEYGRIMRDIVADTLEDEGLPKNRVNIITPFIIKFINKTLNIAENSIKRQQDSDLKIQISLQEISTIWYRRNIVRYGVEITINDTKIPIYFGDKTQTILYIAALIRFKMGIPLYLHELYRNSCGYLSIYKKDKTYRWLEQIFRKIFGQNSKFDDWAKPERNGEAAPRAGHDFHQAKSVISKKLNNVLAENSATVLDYCCLHIDTDESGDSFYTFKCSPDDIILDDTARELGIFFKKLYGSRA